MFVNRNLFLLLILAVTLLHAQPPAVCSCGANPPGPPPIRELHPYAKAPEDMRPYSSFTAPYYENYGKLVEYNGAARDVPTVKPEQIDEVRIGFLGPVENHPDQKLGQAMLNGAQLAIEEANAARGYGGKPFRLMVHNDQAVWGASSNEIVKMAYDERVWAMLGSISAFGRFSDSRGRAMASSPVAHCIPRAGDGQREFTACGSCRLERDLR